jgi:hypothetical protein
MIYLLTAIGLTPAGSRSCDDSNLFFQGKGIDRNYYYYYYHYLVIIIIINCQFVGQVLVI